MRGVEGDVRTESRYSRCLNCSVPSVAVAVRLVGFVEQRMSVRAACSCAGHWRYVVQFFSDELCSDSFRSLHL